MIDHGSYARAYAARSVEFEELARRASALGDAMVAAFYMSESAAARGKAGFHASRV